MSKPFDLLILSNGPGEIATWVRPVVAAIREQFGSLPRISVVLSPCSHSTGQEAAIARSYVGVDRVQAAEHFFSFLLWGKTAENWSWFDQGVVLFLGGDQIFPLVIGKRLGFKTLIYAEWEARWWRFIDGFCAMNTNVVAQVPPRYQHKFAIVGDLMVDVPPESGLQTGDAGTTIGLLPGSKAMKLAQGVPFFLAIAEQLTQTRPDLRFILPVAPTLSLQTLSKFADLKHNPVIQIIQGQTAQLVRDPQDPEQTYLETPTGLKVSLITEFPAHTHLRQCRLCLTTIGANTAELGALGVPMVVVIPTQQIDAMRAWDGLPGLFARLPLVGTWFVKAFNHFMVQRALKKNILYAWPNIWAKRRIVPELMGKLTVAQISNLILDYLDHPEKLEQMQRELQQCRGEAGAANKVAQAIATLLDSGKISDIR